MDRPVILLVILLCYNLLIDDRIECLRNLFGEEDIKIETKEAKRNETTNQVHTFLATARTKYGSSKYAGAMGYIAVYNPKAVGQQYSASRMRLQIGPDSIEAGWRVDPTLYGDSLTRFFIRTDAGRTHCFNIRCPGFNLTSKFDIESSAGLISKPGETIYISGVDIRRDNTNGNWNLIIGQWDRTTSVGFWPRSIFTNSADMVDRVEWGGEVYSPPRTPLPPMGSSNHPIGDVWFDGFVSNIKVVNEKGQFVDIDLETYEDDSKLYSVIDYGHSKPDWGHVILYGGPSHP